MERYSYRDRVIIGLAMAATAAISTAIAIGSSYEDSPNVISATDRANPSPRINRLDPLFLPK